MSIAKKLQAKDWVPTTPDFQYYFDLAGEICRRAEHKSHLSDDEIIILSVVASQLTLTKYVKPENRDADAVLNQILALLDHDEVNEAIMSKMTTMLSDYAESRVRQDAPGGEILHRLGILADPEEPAPDPKLVEPRKLDTPIGG